MNKAVFFDRDGVLNTSNVISGKPYAPLSFSDFHLYPEAADCLNRIHNLNFFLFVITNQPDIAAGTLKHDELKKMHLSILSHLPVHKIYVCPHSRMENCKCRKPSPYLINLAISEYDIDVARSWLIGDRLSDIIAAKAAGIKAIFIDHNYTETQLSQNILENTFTTTCLTDATTHIELLS